MEKITLSKPVSQTKLLDLAGYFSQVEGTCLLHSAKKEETSYLWLFPIESFSVTSQKKPWDFLEKKLFKTCVGFFSYEMGFSSDEDLCIPIKHSSFPKAYFQRCSYILEVSHAQQKAILHVDPKAECEHLSFLQNPDLWPSYTIPRAVNSVKIVADFCSYQEYQDKILFIQDMIRKGEVYQVNLSQEIRVQTQQNPFDFFHQAVQKNPSSYCAYLYLPQFQIVSISPERLLSKKNNMLETRPIKGTVARGKTAQEDLKNRNHLFSSEKERSELLMITDLMRNDLGKISQMGSVVAGPLFEVEQYKNVYHMLSTVRSKSLDLHPAKLLRAVFPGGSITGCPKLRSMELIYELEKRFRNIYTGSFGFFHHSGDFDFNICIRTLLFSENQISLSLGGAIVIDSDPEKEYEETMHKGTLLLQQLGIDHEHRLCRK